jgi:hypothetical protein
MSNRRLAAALATTLFMGPLLAQEFPARKPGLWKVSMTMPGMPAGMLPGDMQQCVDAQQDAEMQRKALQGQPGQCSPTRVTKTATGMTFESTCKTPEGQRHSKGTLSGDMQSKYTVKVDTRFEPPRRGQASHSMTIVSTWAGACPAGMKAGDMRMGGATLNPAAKSK